MGSTGRGVSLDPPLLFGVVVRDDALPAEEGDTTRQSDLAHGSVIDVVEAGSG